MNNTRKSSFILNAIILMSSLVIFIRLLEVLAKLLAMKAFNSPARTLSGISLRVLSSISSPNAFIPNRSDSGMEPYFNLFKHQWISAQKLCWNDNKKNTEKLLTIVKKGWI